MALSREIRELILINFSSLDSSITSRLDEFEFELRFSRTFIRLLSLCFLKDSNLPAKIKSGISHFVESKLEVSQLVEFMIRHCECSDLDIEIANELQQEVLHFSRIVEPAFAPNSNSAMDSMNRRLRKSIRLQDSSKFLVELFTVVRSRLKSKGHLILEPRFQVNLVCINEDFAPNTNIEKAIDHSGLLIILSENRRIRKQLSYYFRELTSYLTFYEASLVLWSHICEKYENKRISFITFCESSPGTLTTVKYSSLDCEQAMKTNKVNLPEVFSVLKTEIENNRVKGTCELSSKNGVQLSWVVDRQADRNLKISIRNDSFPSVGAHLETQFNFLPSVSPKSGYDIAKTLMASSAFLVSLDKVVNSIDSIEFGHIHLDRQLDIDQEVGITLGSCMLIELEKKQNKNIYVAPLLDDDHVDCLLTPSEFMTAFTKLVPCNEFEVIPESSPIIRSIAVAIYLRMLEDEMSTRIYDSGRNLVLQFEDGSLCELFEDFNGRCKLGCILFEVSLLCFRSAPSLYLSYFKEALPKGDHVHSRAFDILDKKTSSSEKTDAITKLYESFTNLTDPHTANRERLGELADMIYLNSRETRHINVLEEYYMSQQNKVKKLLRELNIGISLNTLYFNTSAMRAYVE